MIFLLFNYIFNSNFSIILLIKVRMRIVVMMAPFT